MNSFTGRLSGEEGNQEGFGLVALSFEVMSVPEIVSLQQSVELPAATSYNGLSWVHSESSSAANITNTPVMIVTIRCLRWPNFYI